MLSVKIGPSTVREDDFLDVLRIKPESDIFQKYVSNKKKMKNRPISACKIIEKHNFKPF